MSDPKQLDEEARLARFFAEDGLPERDPAFSATVVEAIARRRFRVRLVELAGASMLVALVLWAVWRMIAPEAEVVAAAFGPVALAGVVLASLYVGLRPLLRRA